MTYVYKRTEPGLWTAGFYAPDGKWEPESDHGSKDEAGARVAWLNGNAGPALEVLADSIDERLDDEHADRQYIAEDVARQLRDLTGGAR
jgi:hypothetical protein